LSKWTNCETHGTQALQFNWLLFFCELQCTLQHNNFKWEVRQDGVPYSLCPCPVVWFLIVLFCSWNWICCMMQSLICQLQKSCSNTWGKHQHVPCFLLGCPTESTANWVHFHCCHAVVRFCCRIASWLARPDASVPQWICELPMHLDTENGRCASSKLTSERTVGRASRLSFANYLTGSSQTVIVSVQSKI